MSEQQAGAPGSGLVTVGVGEHRRHPVLMPELEIGLALAGDGPLGAWHREAIALGRVIHAVLDARAGRAPGEHDHGPQRERQRRPAHAWATDPAWAVPRGVAPALSGPRGAVAHARRAARGCGTTGRRLPR